MSPHLCQRVLMTEHQLPSDGHKQSLELLRGWKPHYICSTQNWDVSETDAKARVCGVDEAARDLCGVGNATAAAKVLFQTKPRTEQLRNVCCSLCFNPSCTLNLTAKSTLLTIPLVHKSALNPSTAPSAGRMQSRLPQPFLSCTNPLIFRRSPEPRPPAPWPLVDLLPSHLHSPLLTSARPHWLLPRNALSAPFRTLYILNLPLRPQLPSVGVS